MTHFLVTALGTSGDVHPLLAIGAALQRAGHDVTVIANPVFEPLVRAAGLSFAPVGSEAEYRRLTSKPEMWSWPQGIDLAFRDSWIPDMAPVYQQIAAHHRPGSTVLVAIPIALGARIAAEKLGLPLASVLPTPLYLRSARDTPRPGPFAIPGPVLAKRLAFRGLDLFIDWRLAPAVNRFRKELGLRPVRRLFKGWILSPERVIGLWPDWFAAPQCDWPPHVSLPGFVRHDRSGCQGRASAQLLERPPDPGTVVMTAGSAIPHAREFLNVAVGAAKLSGRPFIVTGVPESPDDNTLPPNVRVLSYAPFSQLLPGCAAIVHHGGIGTMAEAIAAGVPQVMMPLAFDQFDNARRAAELGIARVLPRHKLTAARLTSVIQEVVHSQEMANRCAQLRAKMDRETPLREAVRLIEALADRPPLARGSADRS